MAITKMQIKKFIDNVERGVTVVTRKPTKPGETMPIFIPKLMPFIKKGSPTTKSTVTTGNMMFINDASCKPNAPMVVRSQNYISPKFDASGSWKGIVEDEEKDMVPSGTNVNVTFASGNMLNPTFKPD